MLSQVLRFSIKHNVLVVFLTLGMIGLGVWRYQDLPIDAVPDITNVQVQINTQAPGYSPLETEQRITFPIETLMSGLARHKETRSLSKYGLSQVTVVFEDGTDIYFARQQVGEKIQEATSNLPEGIKPVMGPVSTGLGEIVMWTLKADENAKKADGTPYNAMDLRVLQDWVIRPQVRMVPGVTEVNSMGGYQKQFHVTPDPRRMMSHGVSLNQIIDALERNNANMGAGYIEKRGEQYLVRVPGQAQTSDDLKNIVVTEQKNHPLKLGQVADVSLGKELRTGAATANGYETVLGTAVMLIGSNSRNVAVAVSQKLQEVQKSLPSGVNLKEVYNRTILVDKAIHTVQKNLFEGAVLVVVVLFVFLGNLKAAVITAMVIPVSMCFTITGMVQNELTANLMSLGALDFGIIVDGAVVIVENSLRRLSGAQKRTDHVLSRAQREEVVLEATQKTMKPILFGQLIIMLVYLPILTLTGVEGKMFIPMALTVLMALLGAMVLSFTFVPAAIVLFVTGRLSTQENWVIAWVKKGYEPLLNWSLTHKLPVMAGVLTLGLLCGGLGLTLGAEFVPSLDEGDIVIQPVRIPGTSLTQSVEMQHVIDKKLSELPEVDNVFSRIGTAEVASDPMSPNEVDTFVILKPPSQWREQIHSKADLISDIEGLLQDLPGSSYEFTQPIEMRFNELIAGVRSDVAVKVFGDDLDTLLQTGEKIAQILKTVSGASDVKVEQLDGLPILSMQLKRAEMARYGVSVNDIQTLIKTAIGGQSVGQIFEGDRRFDVVVRLPENLRNDLQEIARLPVAIPRENRPLFLPLSTFVDMDLSPGPNQISRENGKRRAVVTANVRGRDIGSFVADAQLQIEKNVQLPAGYWMTWGGQFQQMVSAARRLQVVVPLAMLLILMLLYMSFGNLKDALLVFSGVPLALTGGILALWIRGIPLSISAGIGFIALSGVAVLNGLVMIEFIKELYDEGVPLKQAIVEGALMRLRPVLMTALVASLGFVPMALAHSTGAEVQRPLATVVIGGIISSTLLTLIVLPALYQFFNRNRHQGGVL